VRGSSHPEVEQRDNGDQHDGPGPPQRLVHPGSTASIGVIRRGDMGRMASDQGKW
jgi:hypothetical protein